MTSSAERLWLAAIVGFGVLLRLWTNDVAAFSRADEAVYVDLSRRLAEGGFFSTYAGIAAEWMNDARWWNYPNPLRFGHLALTTTAVRIYGSADPRALAWLSTLSGIAVLPLLFAVARRLTDAHAALLATMFVAVSPIELAMGRRALQDEVLCCAAVLAFLAVLAALESMSVQRMALAISALTFAASVKETLFLLFPALAVFVLLLSDRSRLSLRHVALFAVPPLLWWAALAALTRDLAMPVRTARLVAASMSASYVVQFQSGPPHRLLFDLFLVAPLVTVLACAAVVSLVLDVRRDRRMAAVAGFLVVAFATFSLLASKNLRFVVMLDPFVRLLAAWMVATRATAVLPAGIANAVIELELFRAVFRTGAVYDPVTHTLLEALGAVPRDASSPPEAMLWPWICVAVAAGAWAMRFVPGVRDRLGQPG